MSKVLILLTDIPFHDEHVTTGASSRARMIGEGLKSKGHDVCYAVPKAIYNDCSDAVKSTYELYWHSTVSLRRTLNIVKPDVVVREWHGNLELLKSVGDIPIAFDLPASYLLEVQSQGIPMELEIENKIKSIAYGDYFICSNQRQWYYYIPWLMLAGVDTTVDNMGIIPISANPHLPPLQEQPSEPVFVWGGMFWPWQDPILFLNIIIDELERASYGTLNIIGGRFPYNCYINRKYIDIPNILKKSDRVSFKPLLSYKEMLNIFSASSIGVDISKDSPERHLSSPFKTVDYLSCGLPIITSAYMNIADLINKYNAGWCVEPSDEYLFREVIRYILKNYKDISPLKTNARTLIKENFTWDKTIEPLHQFCINPKKREKHFPVYLNTVSYNVGVRLRELKKYEESIKEFENLVDDKGAPIEWIHFHKALTYIEQNMLDMAIKEMQKEEELYPKPVIKIHLGRIMRLKKHRDESLNILFNTLDEYGYLEWLYFEIALTFIEKQDINQALLYFEKEDDRFPKAIAKFHIGRILRLEGNMDKCIEYLKNALEEEPEEMYVRGELSLAYSLIGDIEKAIVYFLEEEQKFQHEINYELYTLASACKRAGVIDKAIEYFNALLDRKHVEKLHRGGAYFHLAEISLNQKQYKYAQELLLKCLELIPNHKKASQYYKDMDIKLSAHCF
ncbi:MAG: glycosyltransferase [Candidatus Magnetoovum sp. WYHC-5]|nr:glycosyltransferase [Candidatus Magnetoovum sp. WYHC-5]